MSGSSILQRMNHAFTDSTLGDGDPATRQIADNMRTGRKLQLFVRDHVPVDASGNEHMRRRDHALPVRPWRQHQAALDLAVSFHGTVYDAVFSTRQAATEYRASAQNIVERPSTIKRASTPSPEK